MAKFLVIGGDGFVARHLIKGLAVDGHEVDATTRRGTPGFIELDLTVPLNDAMLPDEPYRGLFLTAAVSKMDQCEADPAGSAQINVEAQKRLADWAHRRGCWIGFLSSSQVYRGDIECPAEDQALEPKNVYGAQKLEAEQALAQISPDLTIVRPSKVMGDMQGIFANWSASLEAGTPITAADNIFMSPVLVHDLVEALLLCEQERVAGCFNMSSPDQVSYHNAAEVLAECRGADLGLVGSESVLEEQVPANFRPSVTALDCRRVERLLGRKLPSSAEVLRQLFGATNFID